MPFALKFMNTLPVGIYLESAKRFEFDFVKHLLTISKQQAGKAGGSIVSPFSVVRSNNELHLVVRSFDRMGERRIIIESVDTNQLVINTDNISYTLQKVA